MPGIHTKDMARACGAVTVTIYGSQKAKANGKIIAVVGDPNSHGAGELIAHSNEVYADNILTVNHTPDTAAADALCVPVGPPHCGTSTAEGSPDVYVGD